MRVLALNNLTVSTSKLLQQCASAQHHSKMLKTMKHDWNWGSALDWFNKTSIAIQGPNLKQKA